MPFMSERPAALRSYFHRAAALPRRIRRNGGFGRRVLFLNIEPAKAGWIIPLHLVIGRKACAAGAKTHATL